MPEQIPSVSAIAEANARPHGCLLKDKGGAVHLYAPGEAFQID